MQRIALFDILYLMLYIIDNTVDYFVFTLQLDWLKEDIATVLNFIWLLVGYSFDWFINN